MLVLKNKGYKKHISKKLISEQTKKELGVKYDEIIQRAYPDLKPYDLERIKVLKEEYHNGNTDAINEFENIILTKVFEIAKNFYIEYDVKTYAFEDILGDLYLVNKEEVLSAFKKYTNHCFFYMYIKRFQERIERYIWIALSKQSISNADLMSYVITKESINLEEVEIEFSENNPDNIVMFKEFQNRLWEILETLTPREQILIKRYFGLDGYKAGTLHEVGDMYGVTQERVRGVISKALRKMRHPLRVKRYEDFMEFHPDEYDSI